MLQYASLEEVARIFGVSVRTLYRQKAAGKLPLPIQIGKRKSYSVDEMHRHFQAGKCAPSRNVQKGGQA